ncbi:MAG: F0F1 ATP synthase subunit delta [Microbacteriaceae bacterium]
MGAATTQARAALLGTLARLGTADLATGEQLLAAGRVIGDSAQLRGVLVDPSVGAAEKAALVDRLFAAQTAGARALLAAAVAVPWSSDDDLLAGVEEAGIRVLARSAPATLALDAELFAFGAAVRGDQQLELAVSAKLGPADARARLVRRLLEGKAAPQTVAILEHLVRQPRGRRIDALVGTATRIVAEAAGTAIATVTTARALTAAQTERLAAALAAVEGRDVRIHALVDPAVLGGVRVALGDSVIDGTVSARLADLKLQLAS